MCEQFVVALDQGTTSSRAIVFDRAGAILGVGQREFTQHYPRPGWVEHDPLEIWSSQQEVLFAALKAASISASALCAIGITNQRETTILWDRRTGRPIHNAIVWQCRRTAGMCDELIRDGHAELFRDRTGLVVDAYFSGTKIKWLLENVPGAREAAQRGDLAFGTVDSWLLWNLTGGAVHATDVTNAARTMLFNIHKLEWDSELLELLDIPPALMPEVRPSSGEFGTTSDALFPGTPVRICGIAGDQHAALFGQAAFEPGMVKNTYGTGCFILVNTGSEPVASRNRLLTTPAWSLKQGTATYALEGSVFIAGAAVQWLRDSMKLISSAAQSEHFATQVPDSGGVYVVPAFVGLGAPHWDSYARGGILGLTAGTGRNHMIRATLESIAYQSRDVVEAMAADEGTDLAGLQTLRVDGGASANNFLMQFQSDILGVPVERPKVAETTALGAAYLAGLAAGYWDSTDEIKDRWELDRRFEPTMASDQREELYRNWKRAVERVSAWEQNG
jgi:glycerol kinase